ncbi:hypothetical protein [Ferrovibrio xuzhouensis]|uniref:Uncharacterized protein n=1 Tax=Ferrovibrio xuzhouensis TaxID=1576914 RepID=A0ABV7VBA0_9PROT
MSQQHAQRDPAVSHNFQQFIGVVEDGQLLADLTNELQKLIGDMQNHQINVGGVPKGDITVKFGFKLENGVVEVTGNYSITAPKRVGGRSLFWVTADNLLTGRNPKQTDMFRDVSGQREVRSV